MKNKESRLNPAQESISERLKRLRNEAGLTGTQLAERVGTTQSRISDIENGKGYLYADELPKYAEALNTTVSELVMGTRPENETLSRETGLSDEALNRLRVFNGKGNRLFSDAINLFFSDSNEPESIFLSPGESVLALFREFILCPERELVINSMNWTNPAFALSKDEALQLRLINALSDLRRRKKEEP